MSEDLPAMNGETKMVVNWQQRDTGKFNLRPPVRSRHDSHMTLRLVCLDNHGVFKGVRWRPPAQEEKRTSGNCGGLTH